MNGILQELRAQLLEQANYALELFQSQSWKDEYLASCRPYWVHGASVPPASYIIIKVMGYLKDNLGKKYFDPLYKPPGMDEAFLLEIAKEAVDRFTKPYPWDRDYARSRR